MVCGIVHHVEAALFQKRGQLVPNADYVVLVVVRAPVLQRRVFAFVGLAVGLVGVGMVYQYAFAVGCRQYLGENIVGIGNDLVSMLVFAAFRRGNQRALRGKHLCRRRLSLVAGIECGKQYNRDYNSEYDQSCGQQHCAALYDPEPYHKNTSAQIIFVRRCFNAGVKRGAER